MTGKLYALVGPPNCGKRALVARLAGRWPNALAIVRTTTTAPATDPGGAMIYRRVTPVEYAVLEKKGVMIRQGIGSERGVWYGLEVTEIERTLSVTNGICVMSPKAVVALRARGQEVEVIRLVLKPEHRQYEETRDCAYDEGSDLRPRMQHLLMPGQADDALKMIELFMRLKSLAA